MLLQGAAASAALSRGLLSSRGLTHLSVALPCRSPQVFSRGFFLVVYPRSKPGCSQSSHCVPSPEVWMKRVSGALAVLLHVRIAWGGDAVSILRDPDSIGLVWSLGTGRFISFLHRV